MKYCVHLTDKLFKNDRSKTVYWKRFLNKLMTLTDKFFDNDEGKTVYWKQYVTDSNPNLCIIYIYYISTWFLLHVTNAAYLLIKLKHFTLTHSFPMQHFLTVFWCFHGVEKGCIGNDWVKACVSIINTKQFCHHHINFMLIEKNELFCYI